MVRYQLLQVILAKLETFFQSINCSLLSMESENPKRSHCILFHASIAWTANNQWMSRLTCCTCEPIVTIDIACPKLQDLISKQASNHLDLSQPPQLYPSTDSVSWKDAGGLDQSLWGAFAQIVIFGHQARTLLYLAKLWKSRWRPFLVGCWIRWTDFWNLAF